MKICTRKTKVTAFQSTESFRTKIFINNQCTEKVIHFSYLGSDISYDEDYGIRRLETLQVSNDLRND